MQDHQQEIALLNNDGVQAVRNGSLDQAITVLAEALSAAKQRSQLCEEQQEQLHQRFEDEYDFSEWMSQHAMEMTRQPIKYNVNGPGAHIYVYQYPIDLPTNNDEGNVGTSPSLVSVQCMTILFNLALTFHLRGLSQTHNLSDEEREFSITNAIELYELCYEMMGNEHLNPGLFFLMSLANNLGHCHAMVQQLEKAQKCFEHLLSMQMYLTDAIEQEQSNNRNDKAETDKVVSTFEGFFKNTSLLILNDCCASAA